jgi:hypothetical protein
MPKYIYNSEADQELENFIPNCRKKQIEEKDIEDEWDEESEDDEW